MWNDSVRNEVKNVKVHGCQFSFLAYIESLVQPCPKFNLDGKQQQKKTMNDYLSDGFKLIKWMTNWFGLPQVHK